METIEADLIKEARHIIKQKPEKRVDSVAIENFLRALCDNPVRFIRCISFNLFRSLKTLLL